MASGHFCTTMEREGRERHNRRLDGKEEGGAVDDGVRRRASRGEGGARATPRGGFASGGRGDAAAWAESVSRGRGGEARAGAWFVSVVYTTVLIDSREDIDTNEILL